MSNTERGCYLDSALIPCPWCGGKDVHLLHDEICWFVWCNNDACTRKRINCFATKEEAMEDWNEGIAYDTGRAAEGLCKAAAEAVNTRPASPADEVEAETQSK